MAVTLVGAGVTSGTSGDLSALTILAGDLIVAVPYRNGSNTAPGNPSGYTSLHNGGNNTNSARLSTKVAAGGETSTGACSNATHVAWSVWRDAEMGAWASYNANNNTVSYGALSLQDTSGGSFVAAMGGHRTASNVDSAPTGMTNLGSAGSGPETAIHATPTAVSSWSATSVTVNASSGSRSYVFEIKPKFAGANPTRTAHAPNCVSAGSYTGIDIGAAFAGRVVVMAGFFAASGAASAMTIGGVSANFVQANSGSDRNFMAAAVVPTGTTATLVITASGISEICVHSVWSVENAADATIHDSYATYSSTPGTIDIPANGCAVADAFGGGGGSWSAPFVEDMNTSSFYSSAKAVSVAGQTGATVNGAQDGAAIIAISLSPAASGGGAEVEVGATPVAVAAPAPTIITGASVSVPVKALAVAALAPAVSTAALVSVPATPVAIQSPTPVVSTGAMVSPPATPVAIQSPVPKVGYDGVLIVPPVRPVAITAPAPTIRTGVRLTVPATAVEIATLAPDIYAIPPTGDLRRVRITGRLIPTQSLGGRLQVSIQTTGRLRPTQGAAGFLAPAVQITGIIKRKAP